MMDPAQSQPWGQVNLTEALSMWQGVLVLVLLVRSFSLSVEQTEMQVLPSVKLMAALAYTGALTDCELCGRGV